MIFETLTSWTSRLIRIQTSHRDSHQIPDMYYVQAASLFSVICEQCQKDTKGQIMGHPSTLKDFKDSTQGVKAKFTSILGGKIQIVKMQVLHIDFRLKFRYFCKIPEHFQKSSVVLNDI